MGDGKNREIEDQARQFSMSVTGREVGGGEIERGDQVASAQIKEEMKPRQEELDRGSGGLVGMVFGEGGIGDALELDA